MDAHFFFGLALILTVAVLCFIYRNEGED